MVTEPLFSSPCLLAFSTHIIFSPGLAQTSSAATLPGPMVRSHILSPFDLLLNLVFPVTNWGGPWKESQSCKTPKRTPALRSSDVYLKYLNISFMTLHRCSRETSCSMKLLMKKITEFMRKISLEEDYSKICGTGH